MSQNEWMNFYLFIYLFVSAPANYVDGDLLLNTLTRLDARVNRLAIVWCDWSYFCRQDGKVNTKITL